MTKEQVDNRASELKNVLEHVNLDALNAEEFQLIAESGMPGAKELQASDPAIRSEAVRKLASSFLSATAR